MMIVLTYDVNVSESTGAARLRKVSRLCEQYGVRVQNSVFELLLDPAQLIITKKHLEEIIDPSLDSIRLYRLGKTYETKIETMGRKCLIEQGKTLIL